MTNILRFVQVFAIGTWVGSIIFFSFVVAPSLFRALPHLDEAGAVVGLSLAGLHHLGVGAAVLFLLSAVLIARSMRGLVRAPSLAVVLMLALTVASQWVVIPRMEALRAEMGSIEATAQDNAARVEFDRLHGISVDLEVAVLLGGIVAIFLVARKENT